MGVSGDVFIYMYISLIYILIKTTTYKTENRNKYGTGASAILCHIYLGALSFSSKKGVQAC